MNRRQFTQSLGALLSAPALPAKALTNISAAPAAASAMNPQIWGAFVARARGTISAEMLTRELNFSGPVAKQVLDGLVKTNIISPANAQGVFAATSPITAPMQMGLVPSPSTLSKKLQEKARDQLETVKQHLLDDVDETSEDATQADREPSV